MLVTSNGIKLFCLIVWFLTCMILYFPFCLILTKTCIPLFITSLFLLFQGLCKIDLNVFKKALMKLKKNSLKNEQKLKKGDHSNKLTAVVYGSK